MQVCPRKVYESGSKCSKLLAQTLRTQRTASYIPHIVNSACQKLSLPQQITKEFGAFDSSLYYLNVPTPTHEAISAYLSCSSLPSLPLEVRELLEEPIITLTELQLALNSAKPGKAPGTGWFYRHLLQGPIPIPATRLQQHLPHLIHLDQVGFVPAREARDNTTKVLNLLHIAVNGKTLPVPRDGRRKSV